MIHVWSIKGILRYNITINFSYFSPVLDWPNPERRSYFLKAKCDVWGINGQIRGRWYFRYTRSINGENCEAGFKFSKDETAVKNLAPVWLTAGSSANNCLKETRKKLLFSCNCVAFSHTAVIIQVEQNQMSNFWQPLWPPTSVAKLSWGEMAAFRVMTYMGSFAYFWRLHESFSNDFPWHIIISAILIPSCFSLLICTSVFPCLSHL